MDINQAFTYLHLGLPEDIAAAKTLGVFDRAACLIDRCLADEHWRADPHDNQVGEIETDARGFDYPEFDQRIETLSCEELSDI